MVTVRFFPACSFKQKKTTQTFFSLSLSISSWRSILYQCLLFFQIYSLLLLLLFSFSLLSLEMKKKKHKGSLLLSDSNVEDFSYSLLWLFQIELIIMINGEHTEGQVSDTYLDNIIKQLEISDGSQQTTCVR